MEPPLNQLTQQFKIFLLLIPTSSNNLWIVRTILVAGDKIKKIQLKLTYAKKKKRENILAIGSYN